MRSIQAWFDEYAESHRNVTNKAIHWICVPVIYFCVVGLLVSLSNIPIKGMGNIAEIVVGVALIFYLARSLTIWIGMVLFSGVCLVLAWWLNSHAPWPLWSICVVLFVLAWIGQFIGHHIEGKKPSFVKDLAFLLIGPAWLLGHVYRKLGIAY